MEYVNVTADRANNSWNVPGSSDYMVYWTNPNPESENVTYAFQLIPASGGALAALPVARRSARHDRDARLVLPS